MPHGERDISEFFDDGELVERAARRGRWFAPNREYAVPIHHCLFFGSAL